MKPLSPNESLKENSNYLRGDLAQDLADQTTGHVSEGSNQLLKFHGSYQQDDRDLRPNRRAHKLDKAYSFMIRIRVPGGVATPAQWLEVDRLASQYGNETFKLTTRQAFQHHGIIKSNLRTTIREINLAAMDTIAACGDVNRNVMCNPNPHLSAVHAEVIEVARAISTHLTPQTGAYHEIWLDGEKVESSQATEEPIYGKTYLPRKFKIAIAVPPSNDVDIFANDLSFIAIAQDNQVIGYNVAVGGGMGMTHGKEATYPRLASVIGFCTPEQVLAVAENVVKVQRDYGDRTNRAHARLKYTIDDRGVDWFKAELEKYQGFPLQPIADYHFEDNGDRYGWTTDERGHHHFTAYIENGRVFDSDTFPLRTALREIAQVHQGDFRLTANQNVIIADVPPDEKDTIDALLTRYGLHTSQERSAMRLSSMACVALPTCGLALAESERFLPRVIDDFESLLEKHGLRHDAITVRMTGCPNGCARPYIAEVAFVGRGPNQYNLYLGGGHAGERLNKLYRQSVPGDQLAATLDPLLAAYARDRQPSERFGDFVIRTGVIAATTQGQDFHHNLALDSEEA